MDEIESSENPPAEKNFKGLGGWLYVVGLGLLLGPIRVLYTYVPLYYMIFSNGTWQALTDPNSESYNPLWAPIILGELTFNALMLIAMGVLVFLFFTKHHLFPRLFIALIAISVLFIPLDAWVVTAVLPDEPMLDPATKKELLRAAITATIWIPYMLVSKRVKATFVKE